MNRFQRPLTVQFSPEHFEHKYTAPKDTHLLDDMSEPKTNARDGVYFFILSWIGHVYAY